MVKRMNLDNKQTHQSKENKKNWCTLKFRNGTFPVQLDHPWNKWDQVNSSFLVHFFVSGSYNYADFLFNWSTSSDFLSLLLPTIFSINISINYHIMIFRVIYHNKFMDIYFIYYQDQPVILLHFVSGNYKKIFKLVVIVV